MVKISKLSCMPKPAAYRRANGEIYAKLNEGWHVKAKLGENGSIQGDGVAEAIDPNEEVQVLTFSRTSENWSS